MWPVVENDQSGYQCSDDMTLFRFLLGFLLVKIKFFIKSESSELIASQI